MIQDHNSPPVFLDRVQVAELLGCNVSSIDRLTRSGRLPRPIRVGERLIRWDRDELVESLKSKREAVTVSGK